MSVSSLILSPLARGLFHQAILESGVANSYFGSDKAEDGLAKARILGGKLACPVEKMPELVACLRGKSAQEIQKHSGGEMANGESFVPVYGTELLPIAPVLALKEGKVNRLKSLMYGVTRDEGSGFIARLLPVLDPDSDGSQVHVQTVKTIIKLMFQMFKVPYYTEVAEYYTKNLNESDKTQLRRTIGQAFADYHLVCPTVFFGEALAAMSMASETYSYRLMLPTSIGLMGCRGWMGVCHGEDLIYVMGISQRLRGIVFTEPETSLSLEMIKAWTNFAKHGSPGTMGERKVNWSQAVDGSHQYTSAMELDAEKYQMVENYYETVCNGFWKAKIFV